MFHQFKMINPEDIISGPNLNLSRSQIEALRAVAEGLSMKDIAAQKGISIHTVHTHLREAYKKLNARGSNNAVAIAIRMHLI